MRQHTVYTEVVARVAQRADVRGGVVTPEYCIVAVAVPGLQAKEPLMPGQSAVLHGTPRDWVDMFVGVLGYQVVCLYLVRGQHSLSMPDDVPGGLFCLCGGGGGQRCTEAVWGASPIPPAQAVALFARLAQEFSWADYGILISVGFLKNTPEIVLLRHFWAGDDNRCLRDAAPDRSFISRFLEVLINFIFDLLFLEI